MCRYHSIGPTNYTSWLPSSPPTYGNPHHNFFSADPYGGTAMMDEDGTGNGPGEEEEDDSFQFVYKQENMSYYKNRIVSGAY